LVTNLQAEALGDIAWEKVDAITVRSDVSGFESGPE
jgi:hypothetical protein